MECAFDGIKVGAASVKVLADVHSTYATCKSGSATKSARDQPNNIIGCDVCKEIMGKAIDLGESECHTLCKKAGSLDGLCEQACDLIDSECGGGVNCAAKVCGIVKLCSSDIVV